MAIKVNVTQVNTSNNFYNMLKLDILHVLYMRYSYAYLFYLIIQFTCIQNIAYFEAHENDDL